ncbi:paraquat-inducible protein A [Marinovum sp. 2_MG-2023]|uniref:paraquat-inducible protein A n=1 Tax=unclassified Marinovum TaxID=2647166 RepID=UPI0026E47D05|nr:MULTISPECIES: paraquat-inducible protein A [unclassified Marinovum]MDO6731272.1 paraquat-inducible protein A [Marinovum sp. 2_MG-2023]MDO6780576.1 paraquat-inducible protein A [Marinovum sp. 1_MG-2023]
MTSARDMGLVACTRCTRVSPMGSTICDRCGSTLASRDTASLQKVWAWWFVGLICYIPANLYPMLETRTLGNVSNATIVEGAVELAHHGAFGVAAIILIASVLIPVSKFMIIAVLALGIQRKSSISAHYRLILFEIVEYIGRWSMIDVFVVAILSALVQFQTLASMTPGRASLFFALSVVFTMLSAQSLDPRLIWDSENNHDTDSPAATGPSQTSLEKERSA